MDVIPSGVTDKKIKVYLVLFCFLTGFGCKKNTTLTATQVNWTNKKAVSVAFAYEGPAQGLGIYVANGKQAVLGQFSIKEGACTFVPAVPFAEGQGYQIRQGSTTIGEFQIGRTKTERPKLLAIYPSADTVPENLLKIYLHFSEPMQEVGNALDFVSVTHREENREVPVFLELQSELWNADHNRLTLWLDPGRIKTNLIPNQERGLPLRKGNNYTISISKNWKDAHGMELGETGIKTFYVAHRDGERPLPEHWTIHVPKPGSLEPLILDFNEAMDATLATETFQVHRSGENEIRGTYTLMNEERSLLFLPKEPWSKGSYTVIVESRLEDLAGNNLNHLFDSKLDLASAMEPTSEKKRILFEVL
ncbi:Ig-like domain-containing protein [Spongiimicrobium sp. 2-473A-2-J]|uniref:Ig-like domain-containing protein n=1 Tax=Eudoraea algarum TaxID=3417568 RepID=UPI003D35A4AA